MSTPNEFPRLPSNVFSKLEGGFPVRLDFIGRYLSDDALCYFARSYADEWLYFHGLPPQMIGIPPKAVILLGGMINAGDSDEAATVLGDRREACAYNVENNEPHDPDNHLAMPEDSIDDDARALDIDLVSPGVNPQSLNERARANYDAKLWLIQEVGTLASPVGLRDELVYSRRVLFEDEERRKVEALINDKRKRYALEGRRMAKIYEREKAR